MIDVGDVGKLAERVPVVVDVQGREVVVIRSGDEVFALRNSCPHQSQSFFEGTVHERIVGTGELGQIGISDGELILSCPWHTWGYDLRSGRCLVDGRLRVATFAVEVREGRVFIEAPWVRDSA